MKFETKLLEDKTKLQEIYNLRVDVWENSEKREFVNKQLFPNGWFDELDESAYHWIITNEHSKIIAAARINIFESFINFPYYDQIKNLNLPKETPFGFYSRLVVDSKYRGQGISQTLDTLNLIRQVDLPFVWWFMFATFDRDKSLTETLGYKNSGKFYINYHHDSEPHEVNLYLNKRQ